MQSAEKYLYKAFGLVIMSAMPLPELWPVVDEPADISIEYTEIEADRYGGKGKDFHYSVAPTLFYLQIHDTARYLVIDKQKILVHPEPGVTEEAIRIYLLGTCMGIVLLQRGFLPLHGSSIATPNGGVLFLGDSGMGKSTIAAAFCKKGYTLISDDICSISPGNTTTVMLHPAFPQLKLCEDSLKELSITVSASAQISGDVEKFRVVNRSQFQLAPLSINKIFILGKADIQHIQITLLEGVEKFTKLTDNIYRGIFIEQLELSTQQFQYCALLSNATRMYQVIRPTDSFDLDALVAAISTLF